MAKEICQKNKKRAENPVKGLISSVAKGVGRMLGFVANLEKQGKSEYIEQGEFQGKTESGKEAKGAYGLRIKIGLEPKDFQKRSELKKLGK